MNVLNPLSVQADTVKKASEVLIETLMEKIPLAKVNKEGIAVIVRDHIEEMVESLIGSDPTYNFNLFENVDSLTLSSSDLIHINKTDNLRDMAMGLWIANSVAVKQTASYIFNEYTSGVDVPLNGRHILLATGEVQIIEAVYAYDNTHYLKISESDVLLRFDSRIAKTILAFITEEQANELYEMYLECRGNYTQKPKPVRTKGTVA